MADALVGIGADLSALTSSLQQIPRIAGTEADKAIRKVQQMSIRASRGVSKAIRQQARENQRAQQAAERAARRTAAANEQVRQVMLAAERETMTASQRAASALQEELRALDRLATRAGGFVSRVGAAWPEHGNFKPPWPPRPILAHRGSSSRRGIPTASVPS